MTAIDGETLVPMIIGSYWEDYCGHRNNTICRITRLEDDKVHFDLLDFETNRILDDECWYPIDEFQWLHQPYIANEV